MGLKIHQIKTKYAYKVNKLVYWNILIPIDWIECLIPYILKS